MKYILVSLLFVLMVNYVFGQGKNIQNSEISKIEVYLKSSNEDKFPLSIKVTVNDSIYLFLPESIKGIYSRYFENLYITHFPLIFDIENYCNDSLKQDNYDIQKEGNGNYKLAIMHNIQINYLFEVNCISDVKIKIGNSPEKVSPVIRHNLKEKTKVKVSARFGIFADFYFNDIYYCKDSEVRSVNYIQKNILKQKENDFNLISSYIFRHYPPKNLQLINYTLTPEKCE